MEAAMDGEAVRGRDDAAGERLKAALAGEFERLVREVSRAVNDAPDGAWIKGSEEKVRELTGEFRRAVFQKALQARTDAADAAFPPGRERLGAGGQDRPAASGTQPGDGGADLADGQRSRGAASDSSATAGRTGDGARRRTAGRRR